MAGARHENGEGEELRPVDPSTALTSPLSPSRPPLEAPSAVDTLSTPGAPSPPAKPPLKYTVDADHIRDFPGKNSNPQTSGFGIPLNTAWEFSGDGHHSTPPYMICGYDVGV